MFITAPICPCAARRLSHTNRPTIRTSGSTHSRMSPRMLLPWSTYFSSTFFCLRSRRSAAGRSSFGPELVNSFLPPCGWLNTPLISPLDLLNSTLFTWPASTALMNCVYVRSAFDELLLARLLTRNAAAINASTIHGTQRSEGDEPRGRSPGRWFWRSGGRPPPGRCPPGGDGGRPFGAGPRDPGSAPGSRSFGRRLMRRTPRRPLLVRRPQSHHATAARGPGTSAVGKVHNVAGIVRPCPAPYRSTVERRCHGPWLDPRDADRTVEHHVGYRRCGRGVVRRRLRVRRRGQLRGRRRHPARSRRGPDGAERGDHRVARRSRPPQGKGVARGGLRVRDRAPARPLVRRGPVDRRRRGAPTG